MTTVLDQLQNISRDLDAAIRDLSRLEQESADAESKSAALVRIQREQIRALHARHRTNPRRSVHMSDSLARSIIKVSGYSDDLVEVEGCKGADEFAYPSKGHWRGDLVAPNGESLRLHVFYDECWHVALGQVAEGIPFPEDWPLAWENTEKCYAVQVSINAPEGTRLTNVGTLGV